MDRVLQLLDTKLTSLFLFENLQTCWESDVINQITTIGLVRYIKRVILSFYLLVVYFSAFLALWTARGSVTELGMENREVFKQFLIGNKVY